MKLPKEYLPKYFARYYNITREIYFTVSAAQQEVDDPALKITELVPPVAQVVVVRITEILSDHLVAVVIKGCDSDPKVD